VLLLIFFFDECTKTTKKDLPVDMHKKALNIQLEYITIPTVVMGTGAYKTTQPLNSEVSPFAFTAGIAVINELLFKYRVQFIDDQVMHHPIPKIGGEDFPGYRSVNDKSHRAPRLIAPVIDLTPKIIEFRFAIYLKGKRVDGVPFILTARIVGLYQPFQINMSLPVFPIKQGLLKKSKFGINTLFVNILC